MNEVAVHDFVDASDAGAPAFEDVLLSGVVLGVGIEVEVALVGESKVAGVGLQHAADDVVGGELAEPLALLAEVFVEVVA